MEINFVITGKRERVKEIIKSTEEKMKMNFHSNISMLCILLEIAIYRIKSKEGSQLFSICYAIWFRDILILTLFRNK